MHPDIAALPSIAGLSLRPARASDRAALIGLLHRTWDAAFAPHLPPSASRNYITAAIAETYVNADWPEITVADTDDAVIGMVHAQDGLIAALHVDPDHWGRGIGRSLLADAERQVIAGGHGVVRLQVEDFNARATALYQCAGYVEVSRGPDREFGGAGMSVTMAKSLPRGTDRLRPYRREDRAACLALFDSNVPAAFAPQERADFIHFLDHLNRGYLVMEDVHGHVVACGGFLPSNGNPATAVLCWGMVRQTLHRMGRGAYLLAARLDLIATNAGFTTVAIETSQKSRGFFERFGFVAGTIVPDGFAPGLDRVEMTLDLAHRRAPDAP
ncbi:MAG TPA: GNAT family N-acetyltransferase [Vineibacter sp.]|nr:GNAT family N-acetyltransferase [Vineibacter sp.]